MHARKGLALPRASHSGKTALSGSHCLRSTLAAAPVHFAHVDVTVAYTYDTVISAPLAMLGLACACRLVKIAALSCSLFRCRCLAKFLLLPLSSAHRTTCRQSFVKTRHTIIRYVADALQCCTLLVRCLSCAACSFLFFNFNHDKTLCVLTYSVCKYSYCNGFT